MDRDDIPSHVRNLAFSYARASPGLNHLISALHASGSCDRADSQNFAGGEDARVDLERSAVKREISTRCHCLADAVLNDRVIGLQYHVGVWDWSTDGAEYVRCGQTPAVKPSPGDNEPDGPVVLTRLRDDNNAPAKGSEVLAVIGNSHPLLPEKYTGIRLERDAVPRLKIRHVIEASQPLDV